MRAAGRLEELPIPNIPWFKVPSTIGFLDSRASNACRSIIDAIIRCASEQDSNANPWDVTVTVTQEYFRRSSGMEKRNVEYGLQEAALKRFAQIEHLPRNRGYRCKLLPRNWTQGHPADRSGLPAEREFSGGKITFVPGVPGSPSASTFKQRKRASVIEKTKRAAFTQHVASADDLTQDLALSDAQAFAPQERSIGVGQTLAQSFARPEDIGSQPITDVTTVDTGIKGEQVLQHTAPRNPLQEPGQRNIPLDSMQQTDDISAPGCTADPSCPYWVRVDTQEREKLASEAQPTAGGETPEAEAQRIASSLPREFGALGPLTPATIERMVLASRAAILLLIVALLRKRARQRPSAVTSWRSWGAAVTAIRQDLALEVGVFLGNPVVEPQPPPAPPLEEQVRTNLDFLEDFPAEGASEVMLYNRAGAEQALVKAERENPGIVRRVARGHPEFEKLVELIERLVTRVN